MCSAPSILTCDNCAVVAMTRVLCASTTDCVSMLQVDKLFAAKIRLLFCKMRVKRINIVKIDKEQHLSCCELHILLHYTFSFAGPDCASTLAFA